MHPDQTLYVLIRIRKSGSQSLAKMMASALPDSRIFSLPPLPPVADIGTGWGETFRNARNERKRLRKLFHTTDYGTAWRHLNAHASNGDIVSGHLCYGSPQLPAWNLRYITLVREPIGRLFSEYRYYRKSYQERPAWRRLHTPERLRAAGTGNFDQYVRYLYKYRDRYANPAVGYVTGGQTVADPFGFLCEHYFHFGTLEKLGTFAEQLSTKLGSPTEPIWRNKTPGSTGLPPEDYDADLVRALVAKDLQLYEAINQFIANG